MTPPEGRLLANELCRHRDRLRLGLRVHIYVSDAVGLDDDILRDHESRAQAAIRRLRAIVDPAIRNTAEGDDDLIDVRTDSRSNMQSDALRRIAAIETLYGSADIDAVRLRYRDAIDRYMDQTGTLSHGLIDEHALVLTPLERMLTMRVMGGLQHDDVLIDKSDKILERVSLRHMRSVINAESALSLMSLGDESRRVAALLELPAKSRQCYPREAAEILYAAAIRALRDGDGESAENHLTDALTLIPRGIYPAGGEVEKHLDLLCVNYALGRVSSDCAAALACLDLAVQEVEEVRAGWDLGRLPKDPLYEPLTEVIDVALRVAATSLAPGASRVALRIMEAQRRRLLAGMLRSASVREASVRAYLADVTDEINVSENRFAQLSSSTGDGGQGSGLSVSDKLKEELRQLAASTFFAEAYLPEPVRIDDLLSTVKGHHTVIYQRDRESPELRGYRCWISPEGEIDAGPFALTLTPAEIQAWEQAALGTSDVGTRLAEELLPDALRGALPRRADPSLLLIAPDGDLMNIPWAGIELAVGNPVVNHADIMIVPSVSLAERGDWSPSLYPAAVALPVHAEQPITAADERAWWQSRGQAPMPTVREMFAALKDSAVTGVTNTEQFRTAHVLTHAGGEGLRQYLEDSDDSRWEVPELFDVDWPEYVVLQACRSNRAHWDTGRGLTPMGLAIACLARGAVAVTGGSDDLPVNPAREVFTSLLSDLDSHRGHPARILSAAQRRHVSNYRETRQWSSPLAWARFTTVSLRIPEQ